MRAKASRWYAVARRKGYEDTSTTSGAWLITDIAQFPANSGSATTVGINMNTKSLSLGAIDVTSARPRALTIGSSNLTGSLTLNGTSINGTSM